MADIVIPVETIRVAGGDAPQIVLYTQFELYKIWFSGAMLVIAILILTYIAYRWQQNRYKKWLYEQDVADAQSEGRSIASIPAPVYVKPVNKPLILAFGVFILIAGIIQFIL